MRLRWLAALALAAPGLWVTATAKDFEETLPACQSMQVPVSVSEMNATVTATVYGELCAAADSTPSAVQLLVHGATYNAFYNDWPYRPDYYSYVRQMTRAGYATFNIERLGYGRSTHPNSTDSTLANGTTALHQVVSKLRGGEIGGHAFSRVIWVGHSLGTLYGWLVAADGADVDAYVLTGLLHTAKLSWLTLAGNSVQSVSVDPKFAASGLDGGYLTTKPDTRAALFYWTPNAEPDVIALDERLKDTVSGTEFGMAVPMFSLNLYPQPPAAVPSQKIKVPTLLVLGQHDRVMCDEDGLICNQQNVANQEKVYYSAEAQLQVLVVPDTGHDLQLHKSAPATGEAILDWLSSVLGPQAHAGE